MAPPVISDGLVDAVIFPFSVSMPAPLMVNVAALLSVRLLPMVADFPVAKVTGPLTPMVVAAAEFKV